MPELPEVETVKETLKPRLIGKKIYNVKIYQKMFFIVIISVTKTIKKDLKKHIKHTKHTT